MFEVPMVDFYFFYRNRMMEVMKERDEGWANEEENDGNSQKQN